MIADNVFLHNLLGKRVRIVAMHEEDLPPATGIRPAGTSVIDWAPRG